MSHSQCLDTSGEHAQAFAIAVTCPEAVRQELRALIDLLVERGASSRTAARALRRLSMRHVARRPVQPNV